MKQKNKAPVKTFSKKLPQKVGEGKEVVCYTILHVLRYAN